MFGLDQTLQYAPQNFSVSVWNIFSWLVLVFSCECESNSRTSSQWECIKWVSESESVHTFHSMSSFWYHMTLPSLDVSAYLIVLHGKYSNLEKPIYRNNRTSGLVSWCCCWLSRATVWCHDPRCCVLPVIKLSCCQIGFFVFPASGGLLWQVTGESLQNRQRR